MSNNLWIEVSAVNATTNTIYGDGSPYETCHTHAGDLYRAMVKAYGRCTGKMFIDIIDKAGEKKAKHVGWIFQKREQYSDCKDTYLAEHWVSVYAEKPKSVRVEKFAELS